MTRTTGSSTFRPCCKITFSLQCSLSFPAECGRRHTKTSKMPLCCEQRDSCCYKRCPEHPLWISSTRAPCREGRKADLLLSQMHLSHSGLGSCDDVTITARRAVSSTRSLLTPSAIPYKQKGKKFSKREATITANWTYILGHQLLGTSF